MQRYFLSFHLLFISLFIMGCSSSPSPVLPPVKLSPIESKVSFTEDWSGSYNEGVSDNYYFIEPVFYNNTVYVVDYLGELSAIDQTSGDTLWSVKLNQIISAGLTRINTRLFLGTNNGEVIALNIENGKLLWTSKVTSEIFAKPIQAGNFIIVKTVDGKITALDHKTGESKWTYDRPVPALTLRGNSSPVVYDNTLIAGLDNGKLVGLSLDTGQELWSVAISSPRGRTEIERMVDIDATPVIKGEYLFVVSYQGKIASIHIPSGKMVWNRDFSAYTGIAFNQSSIFVTDSEGYVWSLDQSSGATIWKQDKLLRRSVTKPSLFKDSVAVADFNGFIHLLDIKDGRIKGRIHLDGTGKETSDDFLFDKSSNILVAPIAVKDSLFVFDRLGYIARYTIRQ